MNGDKIQERTAHPSSESGGDIMKAVLITGATGFLGNGSHASGFETDESSHYRIGSGEGSRRRRVPAGTDPGGSIRTW